MANFLGKASSVLCVYIFLPFYVRMLGIENYGIIAFYAVLLGVLAFVNTGLTATLSREMARLSAQEDSWQEMHDLLFTLERVFWGITAIIAAIVFILAPIVAYNWVNAQGIEPGTIRNVVQMMGIIIALQFLYNFYQGGLLGLQRQVLSNVIHASLGILRGGGAALILWLISPTLYAFFLWQIIVNVAYALIVERILWRCLPSDHIKANLKTSVIKSIWRYAAGITGISIISMVLTQVDKLTISKLLSLETFGYYSLASIVSNVPTLLATPISTAVFPRLTQLVQLGDSAKVSAFYHRACQLISVVVFPVGLMLVMFSRELIMIWTRDPIIVEKSSFIATLLVIGSIFLSLQVIPFNLALAHAWTKLNLYIGAAAIILIIPLMTILIRLYGPVGAAIAWIVLHVGSTPVYIHILHHRLLPREQRRWYLKDCGQPFLATLIPLGISRLLINESIPKIELIACILTAWLVSTVSAAIAAPEIRVAVITAISLKWRNRHST